jgi:tRNA-uridine aminocarboxypropyltransferase
MADAAIDTLPVIDNRLFILILQHPQEKKAPLATAATARALLRHADLVVGLSWPSLSRLLGRRANARRWAVLYLGSARPASLARERAVAVLDRRGAPAAESDAILCGLEGVVLLDGSWKEAKTLWWRNPWLLGLHRVVLNPTRPSRYGRLRREPRREALSTLEATALLLQHLDPRSEAAPALLAALDRLLAEARPARHRRVKE